MKLRPAAIILIAMTAAIPVLLGAAGFASPKARDAQKTYARAVQKAKADYVKALTAARIVATKAADLDEANRIQAEIDALNLANVVAAPSEAIELVPAQYTADQLANAEVVHCFERARFVLQADGSIKPATAPAESYWRVAKNGELEILSDDKTTVTARYQAVRAGDKTYFCGRYVAGRGAREFIPHVIATQLKPAGPK